MSSPVVTASATGVASFNDHIDVTIDCTGTNGLLLCFLSGYTPGQPTGTPTYNGSNLTALIASAGAFQQGFGGDTQLWYMVNPPAGSHTLHSTNANAGSPREVCIAVFVTGANQSTPFGTSNSTNFYSASNAFQDISGTNTTDLVIGFLGHIGSDVTSFSEDGGATSVTTVSDNNTPWSRCSTLAGTGGTVTMSWTGYAGDPSVVIAAAIKTASSAPATGVGPALMALGLGA